MRSSVDIDNWRLASSIRCTSAKCRLASALRASARAVGTRRKAPAPRSDAWWREYRSRHAARSRARLLGLTLPGSGILARLRFMFDQIERIGRSLTSQGRLLRQRVGE